MTTMPTTTTWTTTLSTVVTQEMTETSVVIPKTTVHMFVTEKPILDKSLLYPVLVPTLLIIPVLICCICCCMNTDKEPPPVEKIERESETCIQTCNMVIVPCCRYQQDNVRHIEDKLDTLCDFVQTCNQLPLMWCQPRDQGWCFNFTPVKPLCRQSPCLPPNQGCFPLNSCCSECQHPPTVYSHPPSRMLPLISPSAEALCIPTLSLPPP
ncbi:anthrax toxin receptor-like [Neomonachus schauinslandi]|uniref:Anthrax toxin receptor-like n=1 Tax=Neomonachus schauinslandi TaxID=29088 RepID=A0A8M1MNV3_NEOSC|nr:anthrax toxin receptor-like [Neomonachus schauinslandi]